MANNLRRRHIVQMAYFKYARTLVLFLLLIIVVFTSCNNDVFVEHVPEVEEEMYIDGINGKQTIKINKKALKFITVGDNYGFQWQPYTGYYKENGSEIINPESIKDITKIVYFNRVFALELTIKDDEIEITALNNTRSEPVEAWIRLDYGYMWKYTFLNMGVGEPYEISEFGHAINVYSTKTETINGIRETFHNNTDQNIKITIYPYKDSQSKLTLTPDNGEYWSSDVKGIARIPFFKNGEWTIDDTEEVEAKIDASTWFDSCMVNNEEEAYVEVPPHTSVAITKKVTYAILETRYIAWLLMPNTDFVWPTNGTLTISQPISYQIESAPIEL